MFLPEDHQVLLESLSGFTTTVQSFSVTTEPTTELTLPGHQLCTTTPNSEIQTAPTPETQLLPTPSVDAKWPMRPTPPDASSTKSKQASTSTGMLTLPAPTLNQPSDIGSMTTVQSLSKTMEDTTEPTSPGKPIEMNIMHLILNIHLFESLKFF
jgi:hypothetical protein